MPWGILAMLRSCENTPLPSWIPKELVLLLGVLTAFVFLAHARLLRPLGSRARGKGRGRVAGGGDRLRRRRRSEGMTSTDQQR